MKCPPHGRVDCVECSPPTYQRRRTTDPLLPDGLLLTAHHCGQRLTWRGSGVWWEGIEEHSERRLRCDACGLRVVVLVTDLDPIPTEQETTP